MDPLDNGQPDHTEEDSRVLGSDDTTELVIGTELVYKCSEPYWIKDDVELAARVTLTCELDKAAATVSWGSNNTAFTCEGNPDSHYHIIVYTTHVCTCITTIALTRQRLISCLEIFRL